MILLSLLLTAVVLLGYFQLFFRKQNNGGAKSLPGPRGFPYVGVPHKIPGVAGWLAFNKLREKYGPMYQLEIMGNNIVVVSSKKIYESFLLRKSAKFPSRPVFPAMPGTEHNLRYLPLLQASPNQRLMRKIAIQSLAAMPRDKVAEVATRAGDDLVEEILRNPDNAKALTEHLASRVTCELSWNDPYAAAKNVGVAAVLLQAVSPGAQLLSKLPFLALLWDRLPDVLQPWKQIEVRRRQREHAFWASQEEKALRTTTIATSSPSGTEKGTEKSTEDFLLAREIHRRAKEADFPGLSSDLSGMLNVIGSLLLSSPVMTYLIAMTQFPVWQARIAAELATVCPGGRRMEPSDLPRLPVLRAVVRELLRWRPPAPLNAPHTNHEDQVYESAAAADGGDGDNGARGGERFLIPQDSTIIYLIWAIEREPGEFPDPDAFRPERWLEPGWPTFREPLTMHPRIGGHPGFGWGNRSCLGVEYVETVVTTMVAALARGLVVGKKVDPGSGREVEVDTMDYEPWTIFVRPRPWAMSARRREVIGAEK